MFNFFKNLFKKNKKPSNPTKKRKTISKEEVKHLKKKVQLSKEADLRMLEIIKVLKKQNTNDFANLIIQEHNKNKKKG